MPAIGMPDVKPRPKGVSVEVIETTYPMIVKLKKVRHLLGQLESGPKTKLELTMIQGNGEGLVHDLSELLPTEKLRCFLIDMREDLLRQLRMMKVDV